MKKDKGNSVSQIRLLDRFEFKVILIIALTALLTAALVFMVTALQARQSSLNAMRSQSQIIARYTLSSLNRNLFFTLHTDADARSLPFLSESRHLDEVRRISGLKYLYTLKVNDEGIMIYMIDGQPAGTEDYCPFGLPVEDALLPDIWKAMNEGVTVYADKVRDTGYGLVYTSFWPIQGEAGTTLGVLGLEYDAADLTQLDTQALWVSIMVTVVLMFAMSGGAILLFKRVSRPFRQELAYTDVLTGMDNRTAFELDLKRLQTEEKEMRATMVIFDLNDLKLVNDTYGHSRGDEYLRTAGHLIQTCFSSYGESYRIGGDEFAALCIGQSEGAIVGVLRNDFTARVDATAALLEAEFPKRWFSIAYGVSSYDPKRHNNLRELYEDADAKMYQMKNCMKATARALQAEEALHGKPSS